MQIRGMADEKLVDRLGVFDVGDVAAAVQDAHVIPSSMLNSKNVSTDPVATESAENANEASEITGFCSVPMISHDSWGDAAQVGELAALMSAEDVQLYYQVALTGRRDLALAADPRSGMEMTLLRMISFRPAAVIDESLSATDLQESGVEAATPAKKPESKPATARQLVEPGRWPELLDKLQLSGIVYNVASHMEMRRVDGDKVYMVLDEANASLYNDSHAGLIAESLSAWLQRTITAHVEIGVPRYETPAAHARRLLDERLEQAVTAIEKDPKVKLLIEYFEGTLDRESIAPIKH